MWVLPLLASTPSGCAVSWSLSLLKQITSGDRLSEQGELVVGGCMVASGYQTKAEPVGDRQPLGDVSEQKTPRSKRKRNEGGTRQWRHCECGSWRVGVREKDSVFAHVILEPVVEGKPKTKRASAEGCAGAKGCASCRGWSVEQQFWAFRTGDVARWRSTPSGLDSGGRELLYLGRVAGRCEDGLWRV